MVIRILTGKDVAGAVRYNERKVEQGGAERIYIANYPDADMAGRNARFRLQLLEQYARLNPAVQKPSVHLAIAFHPSESLTGDRLRELGKEVMAEAGYGKQPYLVYQHHDTHHPHLHVVTVAVDAKGNKISDQFVKIRLQRIRRKMEIKYDLVRAERATLQPESSRVGEGLEGDRLTQPTLSERLSQTLETFSFSSVDSLKHYLASQGIVMNTKAGRSQSGITFRTTEGEGAENRSVKASNLPIKPTPQKLTERFAEQAERHREGCAALATLLRKRLAAYKSLTELDYKQSLHQLGIEVIEREGTYLYAHKRAGLVAQEEELGKPFCRQTLLNLFSAKTERMPTITSPVKNRDKKPALVNVAPLVTRKSRTVAEDNPIQNQKPTEIAQSKSEVQRQNLGRDTRGLSKPTIAVEITVQPLEDRQDQRQPVKKQKKNRPRSIHG